MVQLRKELGKQQTIRSRSNKHGQCRDNASSVAFLYTSMIVKNGSQNNTVFANVCDVATIDLR